MQVNQQHPYSAGMYLCSRLWGSCACFVGQQGAQCGWRGGAQLKRGQISAWSCATLLELCNLDNRLGWLKYGIHDNGQQQDAAV